MEDDEFLPGGLWLDANCHAAHGLGAIHSEYTWLEDRTQSDGEGSKGQIFVL